MTENYLSIVSGDLAGTQISPRDELLIGRSVSGEGSLGEDPELSRRHARVTRADDGRLVIEDLGSRNGTYVNGARLDGPMRLEPGDSVRVGITTLEVRSGPIVGKGVASEPAVGQGASTATAQSVAAPIEQRGSPSALHEKPISAARSPSAALLHRGSRVPIGAAGASIGRGQDNDVVLDDDRVSRNHARIVPAEGRYFVGDLETMNGTLLNGERLRGESRWLNAGDAIEIGGDILRFLIGEETRLGVPTVPPIGAQVIRFDGQRLRLGRDPSNDVVLTDPNVSRFHAEVVTEQGRIEIRDLDSRNGTRLNGALTAHGHVETGSEVGIGPFRLIFDGESFLQRDDRGALRLDVDDLTIAIKGKKILNGATISIEPGEFVAVIGESGSGKTTMIRALAGATIPTSGIVSVNGEPITSRLTDIGYVPQDEIVHRHLTVREALVFSAKLRLPKDFSENDIEESIQRVITELALEPHANTRVGALSGGQRKRAGMAAELLTRPSLLFLDEPTTGLDPGLETQMMELFRSLAEEGTRSVTLVTHATKNLGLVDKVCVMGRGGELSFFGPPDEAIEFFGVNVFDGIYTALDRRPAVEWRQEFEAQQPPSPPAAPRAALAPPPTRPRAGTQAGVLARRYVKLLVRDRRNLLILIGQVPVIALATALLFKSDVLAGPGKGRPADAAQLLFLLVTTSIWFGSIDGSREIIKEKALAVREAAIGVKTSAYIFSKAIVLFTLAAIQVALLLLIILPLRPMDEPAATYLALYGFLCLVAFVAVGLGLLISASVNTEDQATSFIPLALIPQLLFAGAIVSVKDMSGPIPALSSVVFSRWSFSSVGSIVDMNARIAGDSEFARIGRYSQSFFDLSAPVGIAILAAFLTLMFAGTVIMLRRHRG